MYQWLYSTDSSLSQDLQSLVGGNFIVARVLARQGITSPAALRAYLDPGTAVPANPFDFPDMLDAVERLERAIQKGETICIWGDFDVDGQTSTTLLVEALRGLGGSVRYHIPIREAESHGIGIPALKAEIQAGAQLILSCDTGVSAHQALTYAQSQGIEVIVTDHHELPEVLPPALAVITPRRLPPGHGMSGLPGVGVAYQLAQALYQRAGRIEDCKDFLDLAALGIVADVALLSGETRRLLQLGLRALRDTKRLGLQEILALAQVLPSALTEEHIGFVLGPRLNALGRLADANPAVELLTTSDLGRARVLALQIESMNEQRKALTRQVFDGALAIVQREPALLDAAVLVLAHPAWPGGIVGIVAARLAERFHRPVLLLSAPADGIAHGSARSVEGVHLTEALAALDASHPGLLLGYGGHKQAAGLSLASARIPELRRALSRAVEKMRLPPGPKELLIDSKISLQDLTLELADDLEQLAPFGAGSPPPLLALQDLKLRSQSPLGREAEHLLLTVEDDAGRIQRVLWWQAGSRPDSDTALPERLHLAITLRANTYRGERDLQVELIDYQAAQTEKIDLSIQPPRREVVDMRGEEHPLPVLQALQIAGELEVWAEAEASTRLESHPRLGLVACSRLAIWTTPPGRAELQAALEQVAPQQVYLFAINPDGSTLKDFGARLMGLVKYALKNKDGQASLETLAAATAQRSETVLCGLKWLAARGDIRFQTYKLPGSSTTELRIAPGEAHRSPQLTEVEKALIQLLAETAAYRNYFSRANAEALLD